MELLQRLTLIAVIATTIGPATAAPGALSEDRNSAVMGIEDEEDDVLVDKRDEDEDDEGKIQDQDQVDVNDDKLRRGRLRRMNATQTLVS